MTLVKVEGEIRYDYDKMRQHWILSQTKLDHNWTTTNTLYLHICGEFGYYPSQNLIIIGLIPIPCTSTYVVNLAIIPVKT